MCSEFFRIPIQWGGVPIFGLGILFACLLIGSGIWLAIDGRRTGWSAQTWSNLPSLVLMAAAILFIPRIFPDGLPIRGYGAMMLLGSVTGLWLAMHRARQMGFDPEQILSLAFWLFLGGIVGARLFWLIEYWDQPRFHTGDWLSKLKEAIKFTEGGLVVYGALIGASIAFAVVVKRRHFPALALADLIAPSLLAGLAFGRIGCLLNGCCYGGESQHAWAITFPQEKATDHYSAPYADQASNGRFHGFRLAAESSESQRPRIARVEAHSPADVAGLQVGEIVVEVNDVAVRTVAQAEQVLFDVFDKGQPVELRTLAGDYRVLSVVDKPRRSLRVHPTQIYSAVHAALLCWFLWSYYPFRRHDGEVAALMLMIYPISRFLLEIIRVDESAVFGTGLSISQNVSLVIFLAAVVSWIFLRRQPTGRMAFQPGAKL